MKKIAMVLAVVTLTFFAGVALAGPGEGKAGGKGGRAAGGPGGDGGGRAGGPKGPGGGRGKPEPAQIAQRMIENFDRDGDGALNARELGAALMAMRERRQSGDGPGKGGPGAGGGRGGAGRGGAGGPGGRAGERGPGGRGAERGPGAGGKRPARPE